MYLTFNFNLKNLLHVLQNQFQQPWTSNESTKDTTQIEDGFCELSNSGLNVNGHGAPGA